MWKHFGDTSVENGKLYVAYFNTFFILVYMYYMSLSSFLSIF